MSQSAQHHDPQHKSLALAFGLLMLAGCGVAVTPGGDADAASASDSQVSLDASSRDGAAADSATACLPLVRCDRAHPCGDSTCSTCIAVTASRDTPMESVRTLAQACVRTPEPGPGSQFAGQRGAIECDEPFYIALVADTALGGGTCVRTEDCVALYDIAASTPLQAGEVIDRCRFSDFTFAQRSPTTPVGYCDRTLGICSAECRCGAGLLCAFASHEVPAGVCVPPTIGFRQSRPCRAMPDREPCPTGEACLFPVRGDLNIPDRERWGVCVERARCAAIDQYFASRGFDRPLVCDATLTE